MSDGFELTLAQVKVHPRWVVTPVGSLLLVSGASAGPAFRCDHEIGHGQTKQWLLDLTNDNTGALYEEGQLRDSAIDLAEEYEMFVRELAPAPWKIDEHGKMYGAVCAAPDGTLVVRCHLRKTHSGFAVITGKPPGFGMVTFDAVNGLNVIGKIGVRRKRPEKQS